MRLHGGNVSKKIGDLVEIWPTPWGFGPKKLVTRGLYSVVESIGYKIRYEPHARKSCEMFRKEEAKLRINIYES